MITAITAQNTLGVQGVFPLAAEVVRAQLVSVFEDLHPGAVKIGMVHDAQLVEVIVACLKQYPPPYIVYDPVMISTSGRRLMTEESIAYIEQQLFPDGMHQDAASLQRKWQQENRELAKNIEEYQENIQVYNQQAKETEARLAEWRQDLARAAEESAAVNVQLQAMDTRAQAVLDRLALVPECALWQPIPRICISGMIF